MKEFEKLDRFVQKHKPAREPTLSSQLILPKSKPIVSFVTAGIVFCAIGLGVFKVTNIKNYEDDNLFIQESLEWEQEDDGLYDYYDLI